MQTPANGQSQGWGLFELLLAPAVLVAIGHCTALGIRLCEPFGSLATFGGALLGLAVGILAGSALGFAIISTLFKLLTYMEQPFQAAYDVLRLLRAVRIVSASLPERLVLRHGIPCKIDPDACLCPICRYALDSRAWMVCQECYTPQHTECWTFVRGCSTYGCRQSGREPVDDAGAVPSDNGADE